MPPATPSAQASSVKQRIVEYLRDKPFERAIEQPEFKRLLTEEAHSDKPLYSTDTINAFEDARELRRVKRSRPTVGAFFSNKSVLIVPGFMGSQLRDDAAGGNGLIWIDPEVYLRPDELSALRLAEYEAGQPESDFGREVSSLGSAVGIRRPILPFGAGVCYSRPSVQDSPKTLGVLGLFGEEVQGDKGGA